MSLCIIPARGGSKRIKKKNIREFFAKPLIAHSITYALDSGVFDEVLVSTDDEEIAHIALQYGASVPFMRPSALSDDFSSTDAVIIHTIKELEKRAQTFEKICCLYASAVLINAELLKKAYEQFCLSGADFLFAGAEFPSAIQRAFYLDAQKRVHMFDEKAYFSRTQDLTKAYYDAGAFYFGKKDAWLEDKIMFKPYSQVFLLPQNLVCDIDEIKDLKQAEILYQLNMEAQCLSKK